MDGTTSAARTTLVAAMAALLLHPMAPARAMASRAEELAAALRAHPDAEHGGRLFLACAACHGTDGAGNADGSVPAIAGQHASVLIRELVDFRHRLRSDLRMERIADTHHLAGAADIADVAAYAASLPRALSAGTGDGRLIAEGAELYSRECALCHGPDAEGSAAGAVPWLASQHYGYLCRELQYVLERRRANMAPEHAGLFRRHDARALGALADYLSRLPAQPRPAEVR